MFSTVSDENLAIIYKDIMRSREDVLRPRALDPYARQLMKICHYDMIGQASDFAKELFFDEVGKIIGKSKLKLRLEVIVRCPYCNYIPDCDEQTCEGCEVYEDFLDDVDDFY